MPSSCVVSVLHWASEKSNSAATALDTRISDSNKRVGVWVFAIEILMMTTWIASRIYVNALVLGVCAYVLVECEAGKRDRNKRQTRQWNGKSETVEEVELERKKEDIHTEIKRKQEWKTLWRCRCICSWTYTFSYRYFLVRFSLQLHLWCLCMHLAQLHCHFTCVTYTGHISNADFHSIYLILYALPLSLSRSLSLPPSVSFSHIFSSTPPPNSNFIYQSLSISPFFLSPTLVGSYSIATIKILIHWMIWSMVRCE